MTALPASLIPGDDPARLRALARYQLLDASREQVLDDVVSATAQLFRVSSAMLSIVEETSVLVKSPHNLPGAIERVPRAQSLCSATILQHDTVVFEDLTPSNAPSVDISMVVQMGMHFYAGHCLRTSDGYNIGTLCLLDGPPRHFPAAERRLLAQLADLVMHLLELRRRLGPHNALTAVFWDTIYRTMSEQLGRLVAVAKRAVPLVKPGYLTPTMAQEASAIVDSIDQLVAATLRRK